MNTSNTAITHAGLFDLNHDLNHCQKKFKTIILFDVLNYIMFHLIFMIIAFIFIDYFVNI